MKKIYICGDSFGCPNLGWQIDPWPVLLQNKLGANYKITNLSISCASNFLIRIQVDQAIDATADFIVMLATTCTRSQGKLKNKKTQYKNIYDRFYRIGQQDSNEHNRDLTCYSLKSLDDTCVFTGSSLNTLKEYNTDIFDLELSVLENQFIIESSLYKIKNNNIPFLFDQGGFENPIFGNVYRTDYFENFSANKSEINQWTMAYNLPKPKQPHFHIVDSESHGKIADYYYQKILAIL
jgi:hypothetical protein